MKTNHRRGFRAGTHRAKGGTRFHKISSIADVGIGAQADWDFSQGNRGMARSVAGAKKFVNSRFRFHEKAATRRLASEATEPDRGEASPVDLAPEGGAGGVSEDVRT